MAKPKPAMLVAVLPFLQKMQAMGGSYTVCADDLVEAGMAVEGHYAVAEDDHEGPRIHLTAEGRAAIKAKPLSSEDAFIAKRRGMCAIQHAGHIVIPIRPLPPSMLRKRAAFDTFEDAKKWGRENYGERASDWRVVQL